MSTNAAVLPRARNPKGPREVPQHVSPGLWTLAWRVFDPANPRSLERLRLKHLLESKIQQMYLELDA